LLLNKALAKILAMMRCQKIGFRRDARVDSG
jgi:hypothetical protein